MGFFVLTKVKNDPGENPEFLAMARKNGYSLTKRLRFGQQVLDLYANLTRTDPQIVELDTEDFVVSFGFLMYRKQIGTIALRHFFTDFNLRNFDWSELVGQHVILIRKNGQLSIVSDGLGSCRIFKNPDCSVISNAFLPVLHCLNQPGFDLQGCYEYVFAGSCYGDKTLVSEINSFPANSLISICSDEVGVIQKASPITQRNWPTDISLSALADHHIGRIDELLDPIAQNYSDRLRLSFSGGFDSRLILASLLKYGIKPQLFSYGTVGDLDVEIARKIARNHSLKFEHIDKSQHPEPPIEAFADLVERDLVAFDGWKADDGVFSNGADFADRLKRHESGQIPVNGSLGEIYRNFFYLPDGDYRAEDLVSCFFSRYDPSAGGRMFDDEIYRASLAAEIHRSIGSQSKKLSRNQIEEVYPLFRGRYWTGHDGRTNQRFGHMIFPYLEHKLISDTAAIPLPFKDLGVLQGEMIRRQFEPLASGASSYGFALGGPRPLSTRLTKPLTYRRPLFLRRKMFRLKHRTREALPKQLSNDYLASVIDLDFPYMRALFSFDRVFLASHYSRIATLEYIGQKFGFISP